MIKISVKDTFQSNYSYLLTEKMGSNFAVDFKPELTPREMLEIGVFGGKYMNDCKNEFPDNWFKSARLSPIISDDNINFFKVHASLPLSVWKEKGWIYNDDPRGWFQWYCRYFMGRRLGNEDKRQIKRWKAMKRHVGALKKYCSTGDLNCRKKQRQALLHWAYDSRIL